MTEEKEKIKNILSMCYELLDRKGHDYNGDNTIIDNFKELEKITGVPNKQIILIRIYDKYNRLKTFYKQNKLKVEDEKIKDTIIDLINYCIILYLIIGDEDEME